MKRLYVKLITLFVVILIWQIVSVIINTDLFPTPVTVFLSLIVMIQEGILLKDILWSINRIVISLFVATILGIILGIITAKISLAYDSIGTILDYMRSASPVALVPFIILWFGIGEFSKVLTLTYLITTVIWLNTYAGIKNINKLYVWAAKSLGANKWCLIRYIILPQALPFVVTGIRIGISFAFIIIVAAEMNGAIFGLGYHIFAYYQAFLIDKMMVNLIVLTSIAYMVDKLFLLITRKHYKWHLIRGEEN
jgi:ABC-type nitrate/sulfonate/bicarbonate transport system permease component